MGDRMDASRQSHWLRLLGLVLFLLGLLTGLASQGFANPRMGLASHLEGIMNGIFLAVLGLVWPRVALGPRASVLALWFLVYGAFANWLVTLDSAVLGAGSPRRPLAGAGMPASGAVETLIAFLLISLAAAMFAGVAMEIGGVWQGRAAAAR